MDGRRLRRRCRFLRRRRCCGMEVLDAIRKSAANNGELSGLTLGPRHPRRQVDDCTGGSPKTHRRSIANDVISLLRGGPATFFRPRRRAAAQCAFQRPRPDRSRPRGPAPRMLWIIGSWIEPSGKPGMRVGRDQLRLPRAQQSLGNLQSFPSSALERYLHAVCCRGSHGKAGALTRSGPCCRMPRATTPIATVALHDT